MRIAFMRWRSGGLFNHPSPRKRLLPKKKTLSGFEFVSGLADGASAMPAKWSRPVFSFRFYEGKISRALIIIWLTSVTRCRAVVFSAGGDGVRRSPELGAIRTLLLRQPALAEQSQFMSTRTSVIDPVMSSLPG